MEKKLFRSGNGWVLFINSTLLKLMKVNPETDTVEYIMENDTLKIKKAAPSAEPEKVKKAAAKKTTVKKPAAKKSSAKKAGEK